MFSFLVLLFCFCFIIISLVIRFNQEHDLNNLDIDYMNDFVNQNQNSDFLTNQQDIKIQTTANNNNNSNKSLSIQMQPPPPDIVMNSFERDNFFKKFTNKIGSYFFVVVIINFFFYLNFACIL